MATTATPAPAPAAAPTTAQMLVALHAMQADYAKRVGAMAVASVLTKAPPPAAEFAADLAMLGGLGLAAEQLEKIAINGG